MSDKIDQIVVKDSSGVDVSYDIDLPADATPSISSITTSGNAVVGGSISEGGVALSEKYVESSSVETEEWTFTVAGVSEPIVKKIVLSTE